MKIPYAAGTITPNWITNALSANCNPFSSSNLFNAAIHVRIFIIAKTVLKIFTIPNQNIAVDAD